MVLRSFQAFVVLAGWVLASGAVPAREIPSSSQPPAGAGPSMLGTGRPAGAAAPVAQRLVQKGIAVDVSVAPVDAAAAPGLREGDEAVFRFRVTDTATGTPLSGLYPAAWMDLLAPQVEDRSCKEKVEEFVAGGLFARPELDLNSYQVLALNEDATITVVDPLFGFGGTKLLAMVFLDSPGEDWALAADKRRLFVSQPAVDSVAVADTESWTVTARLATGSRPRRVALQPDQGYLWVGWEGKGAGVSGVDVFDPRGLRRVKRILTGRGAHDLAFSDDSRFAFVTNRAGGTVSVIDVRRLAKVRDLRAGEEPVSVAFTALGRAAWVAYADGTVAAFDGERPQPLARLRTEPGLGQIAFAPGGRYGFIVNPRADAVHILDVSRSRVVQTARVEKEPDRVSFSADLAYVRHRGSETVLMIPLGAIGEEGTPVSVIDFPGGQKPFGEGAGPVTAAGIVQAPGARAVLVANPADQAIYYYKEGMAAPMGSFANYSRQPRAVLVIDRSLKERQPGVYETVARLRRPGLYELALFLDAPRMVDCVRLTVAPDPERERQRLAERAPQVEYLTPARAVPAGRPFTLRFEILDAQTKEPKKDLPDVTVLSYQPPGTRQKRQPAAQVSPGVYEVALVPEEPGSYYVYVQSLSQNLPFRASPPLTFEVTDETPAAADAAQHQPGG